MVETDRRLEPVLEEALAPHPNADLLIADVMDLDLGALEPAPTKVVANLPYGVAVPALLKTIEELPEAALWCVMVQREVAERLAASPGTKAYGIPSVLVAARLRREARAGGLAQRLPALRRTSTRRCSSLRRTGPAADAGGRARSCTPHSRTGARRSRGSLELATGSPADREARARRARGDGPSGRRARRAPHARRSSPRSRSACETLRP